MIKLLTKYMKDIDWKIILSMNEEHNLNVTLLPIPKVKDEALKDVAPLIFNNVTLEEFDTMSSETLENAMRKTQSLVSNVNEFEKGIEESAKATKMAKDKKDNDKKLKEKAKEVADKAQEDMFAAAKPKDEAVKPEPEPEVIELDI